MDNLNLKDIIHMTNEEYDPDLLVEMLEISTVELTKAFPGKVWAKRYKILEIYDESARELE